MNNKQRYFIVMLLGVVMNYVFYTLASIWHLPVWLDLVGTAYVALLLEPAAGLIVGLINNFYLALFLYESSTLLYYSISAMVAVVCGCMLRVGTKIAPRRVLPAMGTVIGISALISFLMALWRSNGIPDVGWEREAYNMLMGMGLSSIFSSIGSFIIIKTLDTVATAALVALAYVITPQKLKRSPAALQKSA